LRAHSASHYNPRRLGGGEAGSFIEEPVMQSRMSIRWAAVVLAATTVFTVGCARDREGELIGKWQGDAMSATFKAIKMKEDSGATQQQAQEAAKVLAGAFVDINSDKTFSAGMGGATTEGNWTFNKETGEVVLNITTMKGPTGEVMDQKPSAWTAYLDDNNRRLSFYPMDPESVATVKAAKVKGGLTAGVTMYRKGL
jgi:hypothetical protein